VFFSRFSLELEQKKNIKTLNLKKEAVKPFCASCAKGIITTTTTTTTHEPVVCSTACLLKGLSALDRLFAFSLSLSLSLTRDA
jgi:hypothetical protein